MNLNKIWTNKINHKIEFYWDEDVIDVGNNNSNNDHDKRRLKSMDLPVPYLCCCHCCCCAIKASKNSRKTIIAAQLNAAAVAASFSKNSNSTSLSSSLNSTHCRTLSCHPQFCYDNANNTNNTSKLHNKSILVVDNGDGEASSAAVLFID